MARWRAPSAESPRRADSAMFLGRHLVPEPSRELPVAVARPRDLGALELVARGAVNRWLAARWRVIGPRLLPAILAALCLAAAAAFALAMLALEARL